MAECNHDCSSCSANCSSRTAPQSLKVDPNPNSRIKKIIGVVSGKGGVGKSSITALLASEMARLGYQVGVLDADITGPSIPQMFNVHGSAYGNESGIYPVKSKNGIDIMSMNLLLPNEGDSVIYRGPIIAGVVKQFYTDVIWENVDFLFVDMPPGTGDVPLTVFQSFPVDGIIIVSTPQQLVSMIVGKACDMASKMDIPVLGIVENMSYVRCPDCGKKLDLFKNSHVEEVAEEYNLEVLAKLPMMPDVMEAADEGTIEDVHVEYLSGVVAELESLLDEDNYETVAVPVMDDKESVNLHMGKTRYFKLYALSEDEIKETTIIENYSEHHKIGTYLRRLGVKTILCNHVGGGQIPNMEDARMKLVRGIGEGKADDYVKQYLAGELVDNPNVKCDCDHDHDHDEAGEGCCCCGEH